MHIKTKFLNFSARIPNHNFVIEDCTISLNTTFINKLRSHHAAIGVSKLSPANNCSVQLLADERCRWLTDNRSHLLRLMRKKRKKKKIKRCKLNLYKIKTSNIHSFSSSTYLHQNYSLTTHPVINSIDSSESLFCERCNDCNVMKLFKKRRK